MAAQGCQFKRRERGVLAASPTRTPPLTHNHHRRPRRDPNPLSASVEHPAWLFADPKSKTWVAGYHGNPAPLTLTVPDGAGHVEAMGPGTVAWENGIVRVEAVGLQSAPTVTGGKLAG